MFLSGLTSAQRVKPRNTRAYSKIFIFVLPGVGSCCSRVFVDLRFSCVGHVTNYSSASLKWLQVLWTSGFYFKRSLFAVTFVGLIVDYLKSHLRSFIMLGVSEKRFRLAERGNRICPPPTSHLPTLPIYFTIMLVVTKINKNRLNLSTPETANVICRKGI